MQQRHQKLSWRARVADRARQNLLGKGDQRLARGFVLRLILATVVSFAAVGTLGYLVLSRQMQHSQLDSYAAVHRADARALEAAGRHDATDRHRMHELNELLAAVARRHGARETLLIDESRVVRAAGSNPHLVGTRHLDEGRDTSDYEFVAPVDLPAGRFTFEASYGDNFLDANLDAVRRALALIGVLAVLVGGGVFYLVGGRSLMRSHRIALQRATRDGLTDLPNQRAFQEELPHAVAAAARHGRTLSLMSLDLDDFKFLNDRHGHLFGDALLTRLADTLRDGRTADRPYRVGGDEFVVLLPDASARGAHAAAHRLSAAMHGAAATLSIGLSTLRPRQSAEELRTEADAALLEAKRHGGRATVHFDSIRNDVVISTSAKSEAVRRLLSEGKLSTVFQPIWNLESRELLGVEALTRLDCGYGFAGPAEAFDLAEQIGRVHELDVMCVRKTLSMASDLPAGALLFVNLSPQTIDLDAAGNNWLRATVERSGLSCDRVVIEITERFGARTSSVIKSLEHLRAQGFKLALDDVGTGNSGLEMLRRVGAEFVKIDRAIVSAAATEQNARAVLMAMATYARQTGSFVIAEGIEDQATLDFVLTIGRHAEEHHRIIQGGQGYGLGRPAEEVSTRPPDLLSRPPDVPVPSPGPLYTAA